MTKKAIEPRPVKRCAIYTRKSTEEGLDSEFNTLDNQRLAAENYIASQKGEGWVALPERYDDGGFTGGNMERPALQRLLSDVQARKVDCIVVYKVDRLSRSLLDFAKIIDILNDAGCSFVAVTQNFSTADSLGRLTLNILLSFAQFERELIAERTRDKISAARKQGRWTGGIPVLGYDVDPAGGKLRINPAEAELVRNIFRLYLEHGSLLAVVKILRERGITNKTWVTRKEKLHKGNPFSTTSLHLLLTNATYTGKTVHKGEVYDGLHEAIIDQELWNQVQQQFKRNRLSGSSGARTRHRGFLKGLLHCKACHAAMTLSVTYKKKKAKAYRYYVCTHAQKHGWETCPAPSIPADEIEDYVLGEIRRIGKDEALAAKTFEAVNRDMEREITRLETEEKRLRQSLKKLAGQIGKAAGQNNKKLLADLQEEAARLERLNQDCHRELKSLRSKCVGKSDVKQALSLFDPVWKELTPAEQSTALKLLIETISYDAGAGTVAITFHDSGVSNLLETLGG